MTLDKPVVADPGGSPITRPSHPFGPFGRKRVLLVCALTILALGLRLYRLSNQSFWQDEIYSVYTAKVPLDQVYYYSTRISNSLPTYFLLLGLILPNDNVGLEWTSRLLSALAGALSVPVFIGLTYCWRRRIGTALLAGLLLAVSPLHIWYSQEARAYSLMLFFGILSLLILELALFSGRSEWLTVYFFSALAAVSLHRSALVFPGLAVFWHAQHLKRNLSTPVFKQLLVHLPIGIVAVALMFIRLNPPAEGYRRAGSILQFGYTFMTFLGGYSFGPSLTEIQTSGPWSAVSRNCIQILALLAVLGLLAWQCKPNLRKLASSRETMLLAAPICIAAGYSVVSGFQFNVRYVLPALFGFLGLISVLVASLPERRLSGRSMICAVLVIALWADAQWFYSPRYRKPDARAVADWLAGNKDHIKTLTILPAYLNLPINWYLALLHEDSLIQGILPPTSGRTTSFPPVPDVLILERRDQLDEPDKLISSYREAANGIQTNRSFTGFELYLREPNTNDTILHQK